MLLDVPKIKNSFPLLDKKELIERELGFEPIWEELPNKNASRIKFTNTQVDLTDKNCYATYYKWFIDITEKYLRVLPGYFNC